mmetsp:Transcript_47351/g.94449  ORF Transcript_47351/g.94449 Transcript_47351/m.94449 type:complete len:266 (+) Transcript_47351:1537-2334(+)
MSHWCNLEHPRPGCSLRYASIAGSIITSSNRANSLAAVESPPIKTLVSCRRNPCAEASVEVVAFDSVSSPSKSMSFFMPKLFSSHAVISLERLAPPADRMSIVYSLSDAMRCMIQEMSATSSSSSRRLFISERSSMTRSTGEPSFRYFAFLYARCAFCTLFMTTKRRTRRTRRTMRRKLKEPEVTGTMVRSSTWSTSSPMTMSASMQLSTSKKYEMPYAYSRRLISNVKRTRKPSSSHWNVSVQLIVKASSEWACRQSCMTVTLS